MTGVVVVRASDGSAPPPAVQARENAAPPPASAGPVELSLEMIDFDYSPQSVTVAPGSKLSWKNTGVAPHTVTSPNGAFDSGPKKSGESWTHTFERPGTYAYYCIFHENMKGVVIVAAPGEASGAGPTVGADRTAPQATRPSSAGASSGTIWIAALAVTLGAVAVTFAAGGVALMARAGRREDASIG